MAQHERSPVRADDREHLAPPPRLALELGPAELAASQSRPPRCGPPTHLAAAVPGSQRVGVGEDHGELVLLSGHGPEALGRARPRREGRGTGLCTAMRPGRLWTRRERERAAPRRTRCCTSEAPATPKTCINGFVRRAGRGGAGQGGVAGAGRAGLRTSGADVGAGRVTGGGTTVVGMSPGQSWIVVGAVAAGGVLFFVAGMAANRLLRPAAPTREKLADLRVRRRPRGRGLGADPGPLLPLRLPLRHLRGRRRLPLPVGDPVRGPRLGGRRWSRWRASSACSPSACCTPGGAACCGGS